MNTTPSIQWVRILLVALLIEAALIVAAIPIFLAGISQQAFIAAVLVAIVVVPFLLTRWAARKVRSRVVLHGFLIGIVATLIYLGLLLPQPGGIGAAVDLYGPAIFALANGLRILATVLGAASENRRRPAAVTISQAT